MLTDILTAYDYEVSASESAFGAAAMVRDLHPSVVLLDLGLPFRPGSSLLAELKATDAQGFPLTSDLADVETHEATAAAIEYCFTVAMLA